jgi:bifunctional non-homologous end joining protein LigD
VGFSSSIALMHPTLVPRPFHREGWVYEEKYDGWRLVVHKADGQVRLVSRHGRDHTRRFAELAAATAALPTATLILDGEVAIFDAQLSRFEWLRHRDREALATPPIYMVFDVLHAGREDLRRLPLRARRRVLEGLLAGQHVLFPARRLARDGLEAWAEVERRGYEGLVGKDPASPYRGGRTLAWLKVKVPRYREGGRGWESKPHDRG